MEENLTIPKGFRQKLIGIYIILIGTLFLLKFLLRHTMIYVVIGLIMLPGIELMIRTIVLKKSKKLVIPGITLIGTSLLLLLLLVFKKSISLNMFWPLLGISPALSLIIYYCISSSKNPATIIPGIFILIMSIVLQLFSLNIFNFEFRDFVFLLIPIMIILFGLFLLFYRGKNNDE